MARILIAGCGYIGTAAAKLFHSTGWDVEGWTASVESAMQLSHAPYKVRPVDIGDAAAVASATGPYDAIVHCASSGGGGVEAYRRVYLEGARNLLATFPSAALLFTSSTSVYAQTGGEWVDESSPAEPERATGRVLRETEELVLARGGIVARLAGLYGPGRSALLRKFLSGEAAITPDSDRFVNQVHRDDVASALLLLVERTRESSSSSSTRGEIYNVADSDPRSQRSCYEWLAEHLGQPLPPVSEVVPERKRGNSNKRVSAAKLQALGWTMRYPTFADGMAHSVLPNQANLGV